MKILCSPRQSHQHADWVKSYVDHAETKGLCFALRKKELKKNANVPGSSFTKGKENTSAEGTTAFRAVATKHSDHAR